jgi:hypothetical protein
VHRHRRCAVGALVLVGLLLTGACGGDDDGGGEGATSEFCEARIDLLDRITELEGFELATEAEVPEARERVVAVIDALRTMLDAAPEEIRVDADTMGEDLDDIEDRISDADLVELSTQVPALLAEIGGAGADDRADAVAAVNAYAGRTCE